MKKIFFMALAAIALGACNSEPKFKVEGEVLVPTARCFIWKPRHWKVLFLWIL